jgi:phosphohistidine phosphatase SixA
MRDQRSNPVGVVVALVALVLLAVLGAPAAAQSPSVSGPGLVAVLRQGGYVLVMRHATSPREVPAPAAANPDNVVPERQLDAAGRAAATAMGRALRDLAIPLGAVLVSPRYRTLETVIRAGFGVPTVVQDLADNTVNMQPLTEREFASLWQAVATRPRAGTNTIVVTHLQNISGAFRDLTPAVVEGETLVCEPDGRGGATVVARLTIDQWPGLVP